MSRAVMRTSRIASRVCDEPRQEHAGADEQQDDERDADVAIDGLHECSRCYPTSMPVTSMMRNPAARPERTGGEEKRLLMDSVSAI